MSGNQTHSSRAPLNPNDLFDLTADAMRAAMATAFSRIHDQATATGLPPSQATLAVISGLLTATAGCILAVTKAEHHDGICEAIIKDMPAAFDRAHMLLSSQETKQ